MGWTNIVSGNLWESSNILPQGLGCAVTVPLHDARNDNGCTIIVLWSNIRWRAVRLLLFYISRRRSPESHVNEKKSLTRATWVRPKHILVIPYHPQI